MKKILLTIFIISCFVLKINYCLAFEKDIKGSTGWATMQVSMRSGANNTSSEVMKVPSGKPFLILSENGSYWQIEYDGKKGYIDSSYCMINLPDIIPSIVYKMANAESSIYRSSGVDIEGVTGVNLYKSGKVMNNKLGREEYISPILYSTAKVIYKAQQSALKDGYSLMIYDSYRPRSVSTLIAQKLNVLYNSNATVQQNINYSTGASGTKYSWGQSWFLAQTISSHNTGAAIDVTLYDLNAKKEVTMPTVMHELSTAAIKYYSGSVAKTSQNYSTGMLNSEPARKLDKYMTDAGMTTLASEWWHFQEQTGYERILNAIGSCDFYPTSIVSTSDRPAALSEFPADSELKDIGDLNVDGKVDDRDAALIFKLYDYLKSNSCSECSTLIHYADIDGNKTVGANDIYEAIKDSILNTTKYTVEKNIGYIYTGNDTDTNTISSNLDLGNIDKLSYTISDTKYVIKYNDLVIKEFDIVSVNSGKFNIDKEYIMGNYNDIQKTIKVNNGDFEFSLLTNKFSIKYGNHIIKQFVLVTYSSENYDLNGDFINVSDNNIESFLNKIKCVGCNAYVFDGMAYIQEGNFSADNELVIKYKDEELKRYTLNYPVSGVRLNTDGVYVELDSNQIQLEATITPSMATNKKLLWESSNINVVSVDENGLLTIKGIGSAIITVTTDDGGFTDNCEVVISGNNITYTVTYQDGDNTYTEQYKANEKINFKKDLVKDGYRLVGYTYNSKNYELYDSLYMPANDITLIARWEPMPDITYTVTYQDGSTEQYKENEKINFKKDLIKDGYTLVGYMYDGKTYGLNDTLYMPSHDISLEAIFEKNNVRTYSVTFVGYQEAVAFSYKENDLVTFDADFKRDGYKLIGYTYNGKDYNLTDTITMPANDITLTARWEPIGPNIVDYETLNGYLKNVSLGTAIKDFNLNLGSEYSVKVTDNKGILKTSGLIGTGDVVNIYLDNNLVSSYTVVIKGDLTGDGTCGILDVAKLYKYLKKKINMSDYYIEAGNVYGNDDKITINDVAKLYKFLKGKIDHL